MALLMGGSNAARGPFSRKRRFGTGTLSDINIVPLVDVVLVLLIIFMLTAHVMEFGLEVDVPQVKQVRDTAEELPVISVTRNGKLFLNEQPVNINRMAADVSQRFKDAKAVYVRADGATTYDALAQVISALNEAKLQIRLVAKPEDSSTKGP